MLLCDADGTISRYAVYRNGVLLGQSQSTGFPRAQPGAVHGVSLHRRGDRRRRAPLTPRSALDAVTQAPLPATGPAYAYMLATTSKKLRRSAAPLPAGRDRLADLLPRRPQPLDLGPGRPARDRLGAPARDRRRAAHREPRTRRRCTRCSRARRTGTRSVARISALVATYGYDGVNIDFEAGPGGRPRENLVAFASELSQTLHAQGARLTMAVGAMTGPTLIGRNGFYDLAALAAVCDHLFVMAWDLHWAGSAAGPVADATWVARVIAYAGTARTPRASPSAPSCTASTGRWGPGDAVRMGRHDRDVGVARGDGDLGCRRAGAVLHLLGQGERPAHGVFRERAKRSGPLRPGTGSRPRRRSSAPRRRRPGDMEHSVTHIVKRVGDMLAGLCWRSLLGGYSCSWRASSGSSRARTCRRSGSIRYSGSTASA